MTFRQAVLFVVISMGGIGGTLMAPAYAAAFTCPDTSSASVPTTAPSLDGLFSGANDVTASRRLGELMADLRKRGLKPSIIVDYLVGAYCPLVAADNSLSDKQKTDRVRQFAQQVTSLAYMPSDSNELEVVVQTTLAPDLLTQVDQAASRGGISRAEWIAQAIKRQLAAP